MGAGYFVLRAPAHKYEMRELINLVESMTELSRLTDPSEMVSFNIMFSNADVVTDIQKILADARVTDFDMTKIARIAKSTFLVRCTRKQQEAVVRKLKMARLEGVAFSPPSALGN